MKRPPKSSPPIAESKISKRYRVDFSARANRQFQKLPPAVAQQMAPVITALADDPRPHGYRKMVGRPGFRIKVGTYRAVYLIDDGILLVEITEAGHRREVYD